MTRLTPAARRRALAIGLPACAALAPLAGRAHAAAAARRITDQTGRTVELPPVVRRIVAITIPAASMILCVDGGAERLAGMNPASRDDLTAGLLGRMFPAAMRVPSDVASENFAPNVEALLAARPDLVVQWGDRGDAIVRPIAAAGLPVLTLRYGDSALAGDWLRLIGQALGKAERGDRLAREFDEALADIARQGRAVPDAGRPSAVYFQRLRSALVVAGQGTSMDSDIRRIGARNPAGTLPGFTPINVEQLMAWNPDILLLNNFEPGLTPAAVQADSRLASLRAVRERRVYAFPRGGFRWDPPSQESPLALRWLQGVCDPAGPRLDLRAALVDRYRDWYGHSLSEPEIDGILKIADNGGSHRYAEWFGARRG